MTQIIVGVDESEGAAAALRWGVKEGQLRAWPVTAVLAWSYLDQHQLDATDTFDPAYNEDVARQTLDAAVVRAVAEEAAAAVERRVVCDQPTGALLDLATSADLLVVGARGLGGFKSLLLGSVSYHLVHHARCPVVVVRVPDGDVTHPAARVVVGVDGSAASRRALAWALEAARVRHADVEVVHAWQFPFVGGPFAPLATDPAGWDDAGRRLLDSVIDAEDTNALTVERRVLYGNPASVILEEGHDADLIVLGTRGLSGLKGLLLGSVSHQVTLHASRPVVVVPAPE